MKPIVASLTVALAMLTWSCATSPTSTGTAGRVAIGGKGYPWGSTSSDSIVLSRIADSKTYGYSEKEPILVGGESPDGGPQRSRRYLNSLRGPNGEVVSYERVGSCCPFETKNYELGTGLLDKYELSYEGLSAPLFLYINMYDPGEPLIPQGLSANH